MNAPVMLDDVAAFLVLAPVVAMLGLGVALAAWAYRSRLGEVRVPVPRNRRIQRLSAGRGH